MMVVERIVREPSGAPDPDEPGGAQETQLMRDRRLAETEQRGEVADAAFAVGQRIHDPDACGVAQELEYSGHRLDGAGPEETGLERRQGRGIRQMAFSARQITVGGHNV